MPDSMSPRSTLLAIVLAVLLLGATTAFVAFGPEDDEDGSTSSGRGLPEGFASIPEDVFVERVFGAQRAQGSWHMEQEKTANGLPGTSIRLSTEAAGSRISASLQLSREDGTTVPLQIIALDGVYYVKGIGSARPWWKADPADGEVQVTAARTFEELLAVDTSANLGDAVTEIELVGPDSVEGVTTARYRLHLTQPLPGPPGATPTATPEGQPEATIDVWVDQDDLPIQLVTAEVVDGAEVVVTTMFSRYGARFGISAPPTRQTTSEVPEGEA